MSVDQPATVEKKELQDDQAISFKEFLEKTHPSIHKPIEDLWQLDATRKREIIYPGIRLHCVTCEGERTFRYSMSRSTVSLEVASSNEHPVYRCGDCRIDTKQFALRLTFDDVGSGNAYKYGEFPPQGVPVPGRLLRLFGKPDADLFLKGRKCENGGFGIAAFAYYRRVVENHKNDLFDEIIKVCQTVGGADELVQQLEAAKVEISFSKSLERIKTGLPQGLLIGGHNPLAALHGALSVGLHSESDEECLQNAQDVRLILGDLVERIAALKQENTQLHISVQRLIAKKNKQ